MNSLTLETNRLLLKGLSPDDILSIFNNLTKSEIKAVMGHRSEEEFLQEESKVKNGYASYNRTFILFLLTDKESGRIIGRCGLHNWNREHKRAEIGYEMKEDSYRRKAFMSEAVEAILNYGFTVLKLNRIEALAGPDNVPSLKILKKNNFKQEGTLRQHFAITDKFEDSLVFSLLSEEYHVARSDQ